MSSPLAPNQYNPPAATAAGPYAPAGNTYTPAGYQPPTNSTPYGQQPGMYGGGGMMGPMGYDPNDPNSMTNSLTQSTQATFQIIESIVGAFGGFAQMLESTYMATHSSFFGMSLVLSQPFPLFP